MPRADDRDGLPDRTWISPDGMGETALGAIGFLVAIAFIPGILSAATVPRWVIIATIPALFPLTPRLTAPLLIGELLLGWAAISLLWDSNPVDGVGALIQLALLGTCFMLGAQAVTLRPLYVGMGIALGANGGIVLLQQFYNHDIVWPIATTAPAGLFINSNTSAEVTALILVAAISHRIWWLVPGLLPAMIFSQSRSAMLAVLTAVVWSLRREWRIVLPAAMFAGTAFYWLRGHMTSSHERIGIYLDTLSGMTWLGHGIGSFQTEFPYHATHVDTFMSWVEHAHSDPLELAFELGIVGVILGAALVAVCLRSAYQEDKAIFIAFLAEAAVDFPSHLPAQAFTAAIVAGYLCKDCPLLRDSYDGWRSLLHGLFHTARTDAAD